ncbi:MAG: bifunctional phosphoribosyl-AMP cyclohydrolase/phosphoribosyl-ATP diphosphatase HisIE [Coriobacteriia bacterium]|nr:bifunctional phosphoribosyl-AMP cyclohydrolase/phosphoribosyl-ATP diphosphatase HisIE [Coriobacteriia bacterium]
MADREHDLLGIDEMTFDSAGLITAVVQQHDTREVLMVAYMNREALVETIETGKTWFFSRSRNRLWMKGESSGNTQDVVEIRYDCDADCLLVLVNQVGEGACHTGELSCFYRRLAPGIGHVALDVPIRTASSAFGEVIDGLWDVIESRRGASPDESYTARLLSGHEDKLLKKIAEEAGEVIMAAKDGDREHLRYEIGDVIYHLLVVMARNDLTPADLAEELASRRK